MNRGISGWMNFGGAPQGTSAFDACLPYFTKLGLLVMVHVKKILIFIRIVE